MTLYHFGGEFTLSRRMTIPDPSPQVLAHRVSTQGSAFQLRKDPRSVLEVPGRDNTVIAIHIGPPAKIACRRGGRWFRGTAVHGDIDIIPSNTPARWEMFEKNHTAELLVSLPQSLLDSTIEGMSRSAFPIELRNRHQIRDSELETLCWAIQREMQAGYPSGRLYLDGIGLAVASRLVARHSANGKVHDLSNGVLSGRRLKQVLAFIEDQLADDLSLEQIASVAGLSSSHTRTLFRRAMHVPIHQFIIQRRVELGRSLLLHSSLPIADVAQAAGFAHQSHMARHMRKNLGVTPRDLRHTC
jgi:AraC family transcriptional regulator